VFTLEINKKDIKSPKSLG